MSSIILNVLLQSVDGLCRDGTNTLCAIVRMHNSNTYTISNPSITTFSVTVLLQKTHTNTYKHTHMPTHTHTLTNPKVPVGDRQVVGGAVVDRAVVGRAAE